MTDYYEAVYSTYELSESCEFADQGFCSVHVGARAMSALVKSKASALSGHSECVKCVTGEQKRCCRLSLYNVFMEDRFMDLVEGQAVTHRSWQNWDVAEEYVKFKEPEPPSVGWFGDGYCYLHFIRNEYRYMVARLLGPEPEVAEFLLYFDAVGVPYTYFEAVESEPYLLHVVVQQMEGGVVVDKSRCSGAFVRAVLSGYLGTDIETRIGASGGVDDSVCDQVAVGMSDLLGGELKESCDRGSLVSCLGGTSVSPGGGIQGVYDPCDGKGHRGYCTRCDCDIRVVGHGGRCRPTGRVLLVPLEGVGGSGCGSVGDGDVGELALFEKPDRVKAYVGDALHALDVRRALVKYMPPGSLYTELSKRFVSAAAQKSYLMAQGIDPGPAVQSEREHSDWFEANYEDRLRDAYVRWLKRELVGSSRWLVGECVCDWVGVVPRCVLVVLVWLFFGYVVWRGGGVRAVCSL